MSSASFQASAAATATPTADAADTAEEGKAGAAGGDAGAAGSIVLDRSVFTEQTDVAGLRVSCKLCGTLAKSLKAHMLRFKKVRPIQNDPRGDPSMRVVLFRPGVVLEQPSSAASAAGGDGSAGMSEGADAGASYDAGAPALPQAAQDLIKGLVESGDAEVVAHQVETDYTQKSADEVLRRLLPAGSEVPSSFEAVGHLAHMNLRDEFLPYKRVIGQVILDKNPHLRTVVNKTGNIENVYRTFPMEVIAGEDDTEVVVNESGCRFKFNFADVYWNSKLGMEHHRCVSLFQPGDVVCDMTAGVGPFAIPAALAGCTVFANDLNPRSYHYLQENTRLNKVQKRVHCYNLDARDFFRKVVADVIAPAHAAAATAAGGGDAATKLLEGKWVNQIVINLPATSIEFLDVLRGAYAFCDDGSGGMASGQGAAALQLPMVHCYCFSNGESLAEWQADVAKRCETVMGGALDPDATTITQVRDVAPRKMMMRASFRLPAGIAFALDKDPTGPSSKRHKSG